MAEAGDNPTKSPPNSRRRSSFAGQTFADLFGNGRTRSSVTSTDNNNSPSNSSSAPTGQYPGPITSAAAKAHRRMSISTMGQPGSPNQPSYGPGGFRRRDSISSANSTSIDESAIEDDKPAENQPTTPFARRVSFGARALRDVKSGADKTNGRSASIAETGLSSSPTVPIVGDTGKKTASPNTKGRGDGYNWADNFRSRAERSASITSTGGSPNLGMHSRAKSVATVQPPVVAPAPKYNTPDHFQERILKGDFYMD